MIRRLALALVLQFSALGLFAVTGTDPASAARPCTREYQPVCALKRDGERATFANACKAQAAKAKILHPGKCFAGPFCILMYQPVCARDASGKLRDFGNLCEAEAANAVLVHNGPCKP